MTKTMPAAEAKTNFGALLDTAQKEPVTISRNGRPIAVVLSIEEYEQSERLKLENLRQAVKSGLDQLDSGDSTDGAAFMRTLIDQGD